MLKVVQENTESNVDATVHGGSLLDEIVRDGARQMLAAALQAEVAAYVERFAGEVDGHGHRLVVRNGYHAAREVTTAAGAVPVRQPRVDDRRIDEATGERKRFGSAILPAWARKSPQMAEVHDRMPVLLRTEERARWVHGSADEAFALCRTWPGELAVERTSDRWAGTGTVPRQEPLI
mgnify:CR=1 FL=1